MGIASRKGGRRGGCGGVWVPDNGLHCLNENTKKSERHEMRRESSFGVGHQTTAFTAADQFGRTPPSLGNKCSMQQVRHKRHRSSLYVGHSIRSSRLVGRTSDSPFSLPPSSNLQCVLYIRHGTMDPCRRWDAAARARAIHFVSSFAPQFYNYNAGSNLCTSELQREF